MSSHTHYGLMWVDGGIESRGEETGSIVGQRGRGRHAEQQLPGGIISTVTRQNIVDTHWNDVCDLWFKELPATYNGRGSVWGRSKGEPGVMCVYWLELLKAWGTIDLILVASRIIAWIQEFFATNFNISACNSTESSALAEVCALWGLSSWLFSLY